MGFTNMCKLDITSVDKIYAEHSLFGDGFHYPTQSEKSPARPMLFYRTYYWQLFGVQFVV